MHKVVVFGDLPVATKVCQFLETLKDVSYEVVIGNPQPHNNDPWEDVPLLVDFAKEHDITYFNAGID